MLNQEQIKIIQDYLLRKWYFFVLALIIGVVAAFVRLSAKAPEYSAGISFVLSTDPRPNGGFANLATQLGFDGSISNVDNIFSGDNIIELFKSRKIIGQALLSETDTTTHVTLLNLIANRMFHKQYTSLGPFSKDPGKFSAKQRTLYRAIITRVSNSFIVFKKDKKLIIYVITATSTDPDIAYYTAKLVLNQTSQYFIETKTRVSATSVMLLQHQADSIADVLSHIYSSTAVINDQTYNLNPAISIQRSKMLFNQAKAAAFAAAYAEVMRNLEIAKINLQRETPLYRVIDDPELPLLPERKSVFKYMVIFSGLSLVLTGVLLASIGLIKSKRYGRSII